MDRNKINEIFLAVLINNQTLNQIEIGSVAITNSLLEPLENLENLICNPLTTLNDIALFIQNNTILNELDGYYSYCVNLSKAYQGFTVKNQDTLIDIEKSKELYALRQRLKPDTYNITHDIEEFKEELNCRYKLWGKAFAIRKAYEYCLKDSDILAFSHRRAGWSNPVYKLTENISIKINTNFGYGYSSFFIQP